MKNFNPMLFLAFCLMLSGCASNRGFMSQRNFDIGRIATEIPQPEPVKILQLGNGTSRYIYKYESTGCVWANIIEDATGKILDWNYISDPKLCYTTSGFMS